MRADDIALCPSRQPRRSAPTPRHPERSAPARAVEGSLFRWKRGAFYPEPAEGQPRETLCEKRVGLQPWFLVAYVFVGARHNVPGIVSWRRPAHRPRAPFGACSCGVRRPACQQAGLPPLSRVSACRNAVDEACLVHNTTKPTHPIHNPMSLTSRCAEISFAERA